MDEYTAGQLAERFGGSKGRYLKWFDSGLPTRRRVGKFGEERVATLEAVEAYAKSRALTLSPRAGEKAGAAPPATPGDHGPLFAESGGRVSFESLERRVENVVGDLIKQVERIARKDEPGIDEVQKAATALKNAVGELRNLSMDRFKHEKSSGETINKDEAVRAFADFAGVAATAMGGVAVDLTREVFAALAGIVPAEDQDRVRRLVAVAAEKAIAAALKVVERECRVRAGGLSEAAP